jgi:hypothetical protein
VIDDDVGRAKADGFEDMLPNDNPEVEVEEDVGWEALMVLEGNEGKIGCAGLETGGLGGLARKENMMAVCFFDQVFHNYSNSSCGKQRSIAFATTPTY